jgi:hypothetical protein
MQIPGQYGEWNQHLGLRGHSILWPLDLFWRYVTDHVYIPTLPRKVNGLKERFYDIILSANANMLIM